MSENKKLVPIRRFKEFQNSDNWEQRKLDDVCQITMGQSPDGSTYSEQPSDYILIQGNADLKNGWVEPRIWTTRKTKTASAGDLIMSVRAPAGAMGKTAYDGVIGRGVAAIKGNEFIYQLLVKMDTEGYWKKLSCGSTFESLNSDNVKNADVCIPHIEEQEKIGSCFQKLDNLITLHQRKLEKMKALKAAYLSEMFPAEGERKPKRRFKGFTNAWEQHELKELSESFEYGLNAAAIKYDGKNKYIRITDIDDSSRLFLDADLTSPNINLSNADNFKLKYGDILFARTGASVGKSYIYRDCDGLVYYAGFLIRARIKKEFNPEFVFYYTLTNEYNQFIRITSQRSGQPGVNAQEYAEYKIKVPIYEEQVEIGRFFNHLDNLIALHHRELEKLQNIKNAYLNEMFVGGER